MPADSRGAWYGLAIAAALLDQLSKLLVVRTMPYGEVIPLTGFFNLVHARNPGAAFSFLADAGGWQRYFLIVVTVLISAWLVVMLWRRPPRHEALSLALILGGALGNLADRVNRGFVVDYLDFHWGTRHWPAFNLADVWITSGVALLLLAGVVAARREKETTSHP